ncbi:MAG: trans-aconitate 2-methyltransferase [Hamadaea sp.]|uniref:trans-aconitate 2-methyltransferase n=1 Tax=Hamadaea sp. TaxID=2024425 RepID=UPI001818C7D6|nr:trans-aconitate 2-methyltransferase [Hamadaea sp.]NUR69841.1 trans-aconitate 2-methyltransferase [Hamadaea sp.]NUT19179.1 trans-aconitate 2-methyltransferase [Hamadaea sp.]
MWDPKVYQRYGDERSRPFYDLLARVGAEAPAHIVDLGCGPGNLTASLAERWPDARIEGIDSSADMIDSAAELPEARTGRVGFAVGDVSTWTPPADVDLIVANALLQWVPGHRQLVRGWADGVRPGTWLAFQVPGNFDAPSHQLLRELAASPEWAGQIAGLRDSGAGWDPAEYAGDLLEAGCDVDAWETTYLHLLPASSSTPHPVLAWMEGTALRPAKAALADRPQDWARFRDQLADRLAKAYPVRHGVVAFPFRRIFVVGRKR